MRMICAADGVDHIYHSWKSGVGGGRWGGGYKRPQTEGEFLLLNQRS